MIYKYIADHHNGVWHRRKVRTNFTAETVPALNKWLKQGSDAVYFAYHGDKPVPPLPPKGAALEEVTLTPEQLEKVKVCASCKKRTKTPDTTCWICAEKHLGTAYSLYAKEAGYKELNRWHYLGELNDAANHLDGVAHEYAEKIRSLRHDIQMDIKISDERWQELAVEFYTIKPKGE